MRSSSHERSARGRAPTPPFAPSAKHEPVRVFVFHQHYWPESAATAQILSDVCEDLALNGCEVTVFCGQPSYHVRQHAQPLPVHEVHRGVQIHRVWCYAPRKRSIPKRLLQYTSYFATSLAAAVARRPPDVCFVMSTPPLLLGLSGALMKALRGVPFIYSVQDIYPDVAIHLGVIKKGRPTTAMIETFANACYRSAAALVTLSDGMAERLIAKGVAPEKVHVISNWADTIAITPQPRDNPFARTNALAEGFVAQYSGNLGLTQGLDCLIDAAELLKDLPLQIALVGDGNARDALQQAVSSRRLRNVRFFPPQRREHLAQVLSSCDLGLVTMKRGVSRDLVPSKLYGIMAAGRPVVAAVEADSEVARVIGMSKCGWVTEPESATALAATIREAFQSAQQRQQFGECGRLASVNTYSRRISTRKYAALISALAARPLVSSRRDTESADRASS
jgi:colanic acid biosynthesis glycosyl transferase WcaI